MEKQSYLVDITKVSTCSQVDIDTAYAAKLSNELNWSSTETIDNPPSPSIASFLWSCLAPHRSFYHNFVLAEIITFLLFLSTSIFKYSRDCNSSCPRDFDYRTQTIEPAFFATYLTGFLYIRPRTPFPGNIPEKKSPYNGPWVKTYKLLSALGYVHEVVWALHLFWTVLSILLGVDGIRPAPQWVTMECEDADIKCVWRNLVLSLQHVGYRLYAWIGMYLVMVIDCDVRWYMRECRQWMRRQQAQKEDAVVGVVDVEKVASFVPKLRCI